MYVHTVPVMNFETANKANKDFTQGILDIEDLVELGQKHR